MAKILIQAWKASQHEMSARQALPPEPIGLHSGTRGNPSRNGGKHCSKPLGDRLAPATEFCRVGAQSGRKPPKNFA
jgi:hypothetical protein